MPPINAWPRSTPGCVRTAIPNGMGGKGLGRLSRCPSAPRQGRNAQHRSRPTQSGSHDSPLSIRHQRRAETPLRATVIARILSSVRPTFVLPSPLFLFLNSPSQSGSPRSHSITPPRHQYLQEQSTMTFYYPLSICLSFRSWLFSYSIVRHRRVVRVCGWSNH